STEYNKAKQTLVDTEEQTEDKLSELVDAVTIDKYLRVVDIAEIKQNDFNLNISRYIDTSEKEEIINIQNTLDNLHSLELQLKEVDKQLSSFMSLLTREKSND
ncbi:N-6 DNA methylase, partial [Vibrio parahaemolyticus]|uniref:N-6 DNA methylase n=2 Tax=Vibrionaceae TaxID=641 RepID=UPI00146C9EAC